MTRDDDAGTPPMAKTLLQTIGSLVKSLRKERGLTIAQLSTDAGLSSAMVSQIERGLANPSFTTFVQLAHALDVPVGRFFLGQEESKSPVVRKNERRNLKGVARKSVGEIVYELLTPDLNGALEAQWIVSSPGHDTSATPFQHGGEEFGIILSGKKDVYLDGVRHTLEEGDAITFASEIPHWYVNAYDETCVAIWVNTPPTW